MKKQITLLLLLAACQQKPAPTIRFTGDTAVWKNMDSIIQWPDTSMAGYKPEDTIEAFVRRCCHMRDHPMGWHAPYQQYTSGGQLVYIIYGDVTIATRLDSMPYFDRLMNNKK
jgi:hypothetical protein